MSIPVIDAKPDTAELPTCAQPRLDFLWLELTQKCNLRCQHCYVSSTPDLPLHGKMRHQDWIRAIHEAAALGCRSIQFIGGEPLLYPKIEDLISEARALNFELIEIYTNGTPVTLDRAELFSRSGVRVACSFYSASAETHDAITQKHGSFGKTVTALRNLKKMHVPLRIGFIEMEQNKGHFEAAKKFLENLGITEIRQDSTQAFGRGEMQVERRIPPKGKFDGLCGQCCRNRMCLTYSGEVSPCPMSRGFVVGNFIEDGLQEVLHSELLSTFQREMKRELFENRERQPLSDTTAPAPCGPGPVPCMVCGPGNCNPDFICDPDIPCPICFPGLCIPG